MSPESYFVQAADDLRRTAALAPMISSFADSAWRRLEMGGCIYWMGNGGSAGDAQHLATELVSRLIHQRRAIPSAAFTTNSSLLTAIANDFDFKEVFRRQVEAYVGALDVVIGISTSGRSENVLLALEDARKLGALTCILTSDNLALEEEPADFVLRVPSTTVSHIQECHIAIGHYLCLVWESRVVNS